MLKHVCYLNVILKKVKEVKLHKSAIRLDKAMK